jgi:hypothetical protein
MDAQTGERCVSRERRVNLGKDTVIELSDPDFVEAQHSERIEWI